MGTGHCRKVLLIFTAATGVVFAILFAGSLHPSANHHDIGFTPLELIAKNGYPAESHIVVTEDGYILTLHRISHGKESPANTSRIPVLVMHGVLLSSHDFVSMGPKKGLGYLLADAGYDVWLGNARGNTWSKKHVTLSPSSSKFWEFSWHEMGVYDLPAVIDYILKKTNNDKLYYVGMSMGSTMFYVMASERPEYNNKVKLMIAVAPAIFVEHCTSPAFRIFGTAGEEIEWFTNLVGINQVIPHTWLTTFIGQWFCSDGAITQGICSDIYSSIGGLNQKELNPSIFPLMMSHTPAGSSIRNFFHLGQTMKTGEFRQYSYGEKKNLEVYGSRVPPKYNFNKITVPIAIIYGQNDRITPPQDVAKTKEMTPKVVAYKQVMDNSFQHLDFIWATHVKALVYNDVISLLSKH